jgi:hypothetical protein
MYQNPQSQTRRQRASLLLCFMACGSSTPRLVHHAQSGFPCKCYLRRGYTNTNVDPLGCAKFHGQLQILCCLDNPLQKGRHLNEFASSSATIRTGSSLINQQRPRCTRLVKPHVNLTRQLVPRAPRTTMLEAPVPPPHNLSLTRRPSQSYSSPTSRATMNMRHRYRALLLPLHFP